MQVKNRKYFLTTLILIFILSACGGGNVPAQDAETVLTQAAELAAQGLTETAAAAPSVVPTEAATATSAPATPTTIPTNAFVASPTPTLGALMTATSEGAGPAPTLPPIKPTRTPNKGGGGNNNNNNQYRNETPQPKRRESTPTIDVAEDDLPF